MYLKAFSVRDSKGEMFNTPFFKKTHGEAERAFQALVTDPSSFVAKFPDDFDLYFIGEYDDSKGIFIAIDTPQHIMKASLIKV